MAIIVYNYPTSKILCPQLGFPEDCVWCLETLNYLGKVDLKMLPVKERKGKSEAEYFFVDLRGTSGSFVITLYMDSGSSVSLYPPSFSLTHFIPSFHYLKILTDCIGSKMEMVWKHSQHEHSCKFENNVLVKWKKARRDFTFYSSEHCSTVFCTLLLSGIQSKWQWLLIHLLLLNQKLTFLPLLPLICVLE